MKLSILFATTCAILSGCAHAKPGDNTPIDYCVVINDNFSEGACGDPITDEDGVTRESCKDEGDKNICTLADKTIISGWETLEAETLADGSSTENVCTYFSADDNNNGGYSSYCTTLETCEDGKGVCDFAIEVDGQACNVELQVCEKAVEVKPRSIARGGPPPPPKPEGSKDDSPGGGAGGPGSRDEPVPPGGPEGPGPAGPAGNGPGPAGGGGPLGRDEVIVKAPVVDCPFDEDLKWNSCLEKRSSPARMGLHVSFMSIVLADKTPTTSSRESTTMAATSGGAQSPTTTGFLLVLGWALASGLTFMVI